MDVDLQARQLVNDLGSTLVTVGEIASLPADDGVVFDIEAATAEVIREDAYYEGIRIRFVEAPGCATQAAVSRWVTRAATNVATLVGAPATRA